MARFYLPLFGSILKRRLRDSNPPRSAKDSLVSLIDQVLPKKQQLEIREIELLTRALLCAMNDVQVLLNLDLSRDILCLSRRIECEGSRFFTIILPRFFKHVLVSIENRTFTPFAPFKGCRGKRGLLPAFLQGLTREFFHETGSYKEPVDLEDKTRRAVVLKCFEQLCTGFGYKYEFPISDKQFNRQIREAIAAERDICSVDFLGLVAGEVVVPSESAVERFQTMELSTADLGYAQLLCKTARTQFRSVMLDFDPFEITPRHGPGKTFDRETRYPHEKYYFTSSPAKLESLYPACTYFNPTPGISLRDPQMDFGDLTGSARERWGLTSLSDNTPCTSEVAKAISLGGASRATMVNKNADKGRQINMELKEEMFIQKGIQGRLYEYLENHPLLQIPTEYLTDEQIKRKRFGRKFCSINFSDQSFNGEMALLASRDGQLATLDLTDASRYVANCHVDYFVPEKLREVFQAIRSEYVAYEFKAEGLEEEHTEWVRTNTYAPMGSAVCFPTEALVFWSICKAALLLEDCLAPVYVYGDDILIPSLHAEKVIRALSMLGLRVNASKTFIHGHFRESCGVNAYAGVVCTAPSRLKKRFPFLQRDMRAGLRKREIPPHLVAWVAYSNALLLHGFRETAMFIRQSIAAEHNIAKHIVEKCVLTGNESYISYVVDRPPHEPRILDDYSYFSSSQWYRVQLESSGISFSDDRWLSSQKFLDFENTESLHKKRIMGLSSKTESYMLSGEDHGFTDRHALMRWMLEKNENSRCFSVRNQCSLEKGQHDY